MGLHRAPGALVVGRRSSLLLGPAAQDGVRPAVAVGRQFRDDGPGLRQEVVLGQRRTPPPPYGGGLGLEGRAGDAGRLGGGLHGEPPRGGSGPRRSNLFSRLAKLAGVPAVRGWRGRRLDRAGSGIAGSLPVAPRIEAAAQVHPGAPIGAAKVARGGWLRPGRGGGDEAHRATRDGSGRGRFSPSRPTLVVARTAEQMLDVVVG